MDRHHGQGLAELIDGYMEAALWTEAEQLGIDGQPDEYPTEEIAACTAAQMRRDCYSFWVKAGTADCELCDSYSQVGHDFWLTRNRHGAGFWDRGLPGEAGERLTEISHEFGEAELYRGDDQLIYQLGTEPGINPLGHVEPARDGETGRFWKAEPELHAYAVPAVLYVNATDPKDARKVAAAAAEGADFGGEDAGVGVAEGEAERQD